MDRTDCEGEWWRDVSQARALPRMISMEEQEAGDTEEVFTATGSVSRNGIQSTNAFLTLSPSPKRDQRGN